jgi:hypothetical protein
VLVAAAHARSGVADVCGGASAIAVPLPTWLAVFGTDGAERFRVPGRFSWVQVVNGRAYASCGEAGGMVVVDLVTGTEAPSTGARALALLDP